MTPAPVHPFVLTIPAGLAVALLLAHAVRYRGATTTAVFVVLVLVWYVPKELAIKTQLLAWHIYVFNDGFLQIAGIPVTVPVGYVFTGYISWIVAERLTDRLPALAGYLFPTVLVWLMTTSSIGYVMEMTGVTAGWWDWEFNGTPWMELPLERRLEVNYAAIHPAIPILPFGGWAIYMFPLAVLFLVFNFTPISHRRWKPFYYALYFTLYFGLCLRGQAGFLLIVAAFPFVMTSRVRIDSPRREVPRATWLDRIVARAPEIGVVAMLSTSAYVLLVARGEPGRLVSWLPLLTLAIPAFAGRAAMWIMVTCVAAYVPLVAMGARYALPPLLFLLVLLGMSAARVLLAGVPPNGSVTPAPAAVGVPRAGARGLLGAAIVTGIIGHVLPWYVGTVEQVQGIQTPWGMASGAALATAFLLYLSLRNREVVAQSLLVVSRGIASLVALALLLQLGPLGDVPDGAYMWNGPALALTAVAAFLAARMYLRVGRGLGGEPV